MMRRLTERLAEFAGTLDEIAFINPHDRQGVYNLKEIVDWSEDFYLYKIANRLAAYEDTGLTPEEVKELAKAEAEVERLTDILDHYNAKCAICDCVDDVAILHTENAKLRKVVEAAGEYTKHFDEFVNSKGIVTSYDNLKQALAELDEEGD